MQLSLKDHYVTTWPSDCFFFGVIQNKETAYDWMMNHFIQMQGDYHRKDEFFYSNLPIIHFVPDPRPSILYGAWYCCPFIKTFTVPRESFRDNIVKNIISVLNDGYYLSIAMKQSFRMSYSDPKTLLTHMNFIYGYDLKEKVIYMVDSFHMGKYSSMCVPFDKVVEAYAFTLEEEEIDDYSSVIRFYKLIDYHHTFDVQFLKRQLEEFIKPVDYLDSCYGKIMENYSYAERFEDAQEKVIRNNVQHFYGIDIFRMIKIHLSRMIECGKEYPNDQRMLCMLHDWIILMRLRIDYLFKKELLKKNKIFYINIMDELEKFSEMLIKLSIKYALKDNSAYIERAIENLDIMAEKLRFFVQGLLEDVRIS